MDEPRYPLIEAAVKSIIAKARRERRHERILKAIKAWESGVRQPEQVEDIVPRTRSEETG
jgi:hypothetical protein